MNPKQKLRALAIALLDDDHGINEKAYTLLCEILDDNNICCDITSQVEAGEDPLKPGQSRFWIEDQEWIDSHV